jgi:hypothetical protein
MAEVGSIERLGAVLAGIDTRCPRMAQNALDDFRECMSRYSQKAWDDERDGHEMSEDKAFILGYVESFQETLDGIADAFGVEMEDELVFDALRDAYGEQTADWLKPSEVAARLSAGGLRVKQGKDGFFFEIEH